MAQNTIADLSTTAASNTDFLSSAAADSANANKIGTNRQNLAAIIARFYSDLGGQGTVGGTADAVTLTSASTYQTLESGLVVSFKAGGDNTGAATLNLDGLGAKAIRLKGDTALSGGEIIEDGIYLLIYDATFNSSAGAWVLLNPEAPAPDAGGMTLLGTFATTSGTTVALTDIPATYRDLKCIALGVSQATGTANLQIELSADNGSNYSTAVGIGSSSQTTSDAMTANVMVYDYARSGSTRKLVVSDASDGTHANNGGVGSAVLSTVNAVRFSFSNGGTFDAGSIEVWGSR